MSEFEFNWNGMQKPAVDFAQGIKTTDSIIGERRQAIADRDAEIAQLETELAQVEAQIAEFDRMNPGIASGDIDIAATMMEAGNYAPYQQAINTEIGRRQMNESAKTGAMSGVWNGIDNARNALAGWSKMSDDQREMARDVARVELDKARRAANGGELPAEWYDVRRMLEGGASEGDGMRNKDYWRNFLQGKLDNGTLDDPDIKRLEDYAHENAGRELTKELYAIRDEFAPKTNSAKKRGTAARAAAAKSFKAFGTRTNGMTDAERIRAFNDAKARGERWTKYYVVSGTDIVAKEGL